ncbi:MAG: hypothetical protein D6808_04820, partial [Candidatus Dadabacteria bacterium]
MKLHLWAEKSRWCGVFLANLIAACAVTSWGQIRSNVPKGAVDPRGKPELTVCSQNLNNFGKLKDSIKRNKGLTPKQYYRKLYSITERFIALNCDVIAVQEILAFDKVSAEEVLMSIVDELHEATNRFYEVRVGYSNSKVLRSGFIVAKDRAEILNKVSYSRVELPKLVPSERTRFFPRGPVELQLKVKGRGRSNPKVVTLITFHFKSKRDLEKDPAQLEWETYRMEMAEALARIVERRHYATLQRGESLLILLGDRNSHYDSASAKILEGVLRLEDFRHGGKCRLGKRGIPLCEPDSAHPQMLFSLLLLDPQTR